MKTLFPFILIITLVVACTGIPKEEVSPGGQDPSETVIIEIAALSTTPTQILPETRTPYPSPTIPPACGTTQLGKPGTQTKENNHSVLVEGISILCNQGSLFEDYPTVLPLRKAMLDLDSGVANVDGADIGFSVGGTMRFYSIVPIYSALGTLWSLNGLTMESPPQPTFDQCKEQVDLFNNDNVPLYVCVITSNRHIARVKFETSDPVQQVSSVEISFIT